MRQRFFLFLFALCIIPSFDGFCQGKTLTKIDVDSIYKKGHAYFKQADFENSLKTLRVALFEAIKIKNDSLIANIYNRIGRNFQELSENERAILYYNKALQYVKKTPNLDMEQTILINIANIYVFDLNVDEEKGFKFYDKALKIAEQINDSNVCLTINMNKAWSMFDRKKFDLGFPFLKYVNTNFAKHGDKDFYVSVAMLNGMFYSFKNDNQKAKSYFEKGINYSDEIVFREGKHLLFYAYSEFLFKTKDFENAYYYLKQFDDINTKLYNEKKIKKADIEGINFEIDEYKREISKIESEKKIQSQELKNSKIISFLASIIAVIFGLLLFILYNGSKNQARSTEKLLESNQQLIAAKEVAEEATKVKSQFVSTITHELRTPLYGVIGMTDILQDEHKELENNPHIKSLKFSAQYLLSLVNDILKINKLEENAATLDNKEINLFQEIEAINNSLSFLVEKNNNKLKIIFDDSIPEKLFGDKLRLTQILINIIGNALKFTKNGEVTVLLSQQKIKDNFHFIEFKIKDNGLGIALEDQEKIFHKFVQVGRKEEDYQGTGLGLSIVKKLLHLFQSEIHLESTLGVGTTFSFVIALENKTSNSTQIESLKNKLPKKENYKILVVEDNKINQVVTRKIIEKSLGSCIIANNGFEAIEILKNQDFDVILMDINMSEIDGYQTTIKIRETNIGIPIIALTASSKDQIKEKVIASGMNDIIVKPFEPIVLLQTINRIIKS